MTVKFFSKGKYNTRKKENPRKQGRSENYAVLAPPWDPSSPNVAPNNRATSTPPLSPLAWPQPQRNFLGRKLFACVYSSETGAWGNEALLLWLENITGVASDCPSVPWLGVPFAGCLLGQGLPSLSLICVGKA